MNNYALNGFQTMIVNCVHQYPPLVGQDGVNYTFFTYWKISNSAVEYRLLLRANLMDDRIDKNLLT